MAGQGPLYLGRWNAPLIFTLLAENPLPVPTSARVEPGVLGAFTEGVGRPCADT